MTNSPLGKYSSIVAAIVAIAVIVAALVLHFIGQDDLLIDNMAFVAFGAIFGASATINGSIKRDIAAAHARLDAISAPSSAVVDAQNHPQ